MKKKIITPIALVFYLTLFFDVNCFGQPGAEELIGKGGDFLSVTLKKSDPTLLKKLLAGKTVILKYSDGREVGAKTVGGELVKTELMDTNRLEERIKNNEEALVKSLNGSRIRLSAPITSRDLGKLKRDEMIYHRAIDGKRAIGIKLENGELTEKKTHDISFLMEDIENNDELGYQNGESEYVLNVELKNKQEIKASIRQDDIFKALTKLQTGRKILMTSGINGKRTGLFIKDQKLLGEGLKANDKLSSSTKFHLTQKVDKIADYNNIVRLVKGVDNSTGNKILATKRMVFNHLIKKNQDKNAQVSAHMNDKILATKRMVFNHLIKKNQEEKTRKQSLEKENKSKLGTKGQNLEKENRGNLGTKRQAPKKEDQSQVIIPVILVAVGGVVSLVYYLISLISSMQKTCS